MDDFLEQTAVRRRQGLHTLLYYFCWVIIILLAMLAMIGLYGIMGVDPETGRLRLNWISLLIALAAGGAGFLVYRGKDSLRVEYDYCFTNGTLDISMVLNSRRRRYLCEMDMKDVVRCGPATGPAFLKTLREPNIRRHNWFVNREANLYYFYFQKKGVRHMAVMELSDEMISTIRSRKYLQPGVWHDADGQSRYASLS